MSALIGFRPWGMLHWMHAHLGINDWSIIGCLGVEPRCLAAWHYLQSKRAVSKESFVRVDDPPSRYSELASRLLDRQQRRHERRSGNTNIIQRFDLFAQVDKLVQATNNLIRSSTGNVVLDITSLPKRFFFPMTKLLLRSRAVQNLLVTYTVPKRYSAGALAEEPEPWRHIPLFMPPDPEPLEKTVFVGLGFMPFGLPGVVEHDFQSVDVKLLFPFPPGSPNYQRTWEFVRSIELNIGQPTHNPIRVSAYDVSDTYDHIWAHTSGKRYCILAPFGPKPMSLAMCIYATYHKAAVYYTQPRTYNPQYSSGIAVDGNSRQVYAYCLRVRGHDLYGGQGTTTTCALSDAK
jgi:hypothetical protein